MENWDREKKEEKKKTTKTPTKPAGAYWCLPTLHTLGKKVGKGILRTITAEY